MIKETEYERLQQEIGDRDESIRMYERIYRKGAGCFGVGRRSPEIKKELENLRKKKP